MESVVVTPGCSFVRLFCIRREQAYVVPYTRIVHAQTHKDDENQTFVAFLGAQDERMFATLNITVDAFYSELCQIVNKSDSEIAPSVFVRDEGSFTQR